MTMRSLLTGYSGVCKITPPDYTSELLVFASSYNLSLNHNIIKSNAIGKIYSSSQYSRLGMLAIRDYPSYELSITIELIQDVFDKLIVDPFINNFFRKPYKVSFKDHSNVSFIFDQMYLTSLNFSVQNNGIAIVSMNFVYYKSSFSLDYKKYSCLSSGSEISSGDSSHAGAVLMPYYWFSVDYTGFTNTKYCLQSFSFNFSQTLTPKFGCCYNSSSSDLFISAPDPLKVIISQPTLTYDLTYVMANAISINNFISGTSSLKGEQIVGSSDQSTTSNGNNIQLRLYYKDTNNYKLKFGSCYPESYKPSVGNRGQVNKINITGSVYGTIFSSGSQDIKFTESTEEDEEEDEEENND